MIDSINIVLVGVDYLNEKYLTEVLRVDDYTRFNNDEIMGYSFNYKKVHFQYYKAFKNLEVETTTHKVLNKKDITLLDKDEFKQNLNGIIKEVLNMSSYDHSLLTQFDYCTDVYVGEDKLEEYIKVTYKNRPKYKHKVRRRDYETSMQLSTKGGKLLKCYDKVACIKDKAKTFRSDIILKCSDKELKKLKLQELEEQVQNEISLYNGVMRLEISIRKENLKYYYRTSKIANKKNKDIKIEYRTIDNYWSRQKMQEQFFEEIKQYYYTGDYYKLSIAIEKINATGYKEKWKDKLILFLCRIKCVGIDRVRKAGIYSNGTIRDYIKRLSELGINPITIDEDSKYEELDSLYTLAVKQAESKYFI